MPTTDNARIRLRVAAAESQAAYIEHARTQTVQAIGGHPGPELIEPIPYATYLFAWDVAADSPVGMIESCFLEQHYDAYEQAPYAPFCDLPAICAFPQMASVRTIYVEPDSRLSLGLYLKLILGAAHIFRSLGALYSLATTNAVDRGLARLYEKTCGSRLAVFEAEGFRDPLALYLFDLNALCRHAAMPRTLRDLEFDLGVVQTIRARNRRQRGHPLDQSGRVMIQCAGATPPSPSPSAAPRRCSRPSAGG